MMDDDTAWKEVNADHRRCLRNGHLHYHSVVAVDRAEVPAAFVYETCSPASTAQCVSWI